MSDEQLAKLYEFWFENTNHICECCKNYIECMGKDCPYYYEEEKIYTDINGLDYVEKITCMDLDYGECEKLTNTRCNGCFDNYLEDFDWNGEIK